MWPFGKKIKKSLYETAVGSKKTSPKRIAGVLINEMDEHIKININKGYGGAFFYPFKYDLMVTNEVLEIMAEHYRSQGFSVRYDEQSNVESSRYKTFHVDWD